MMEVMNLAQLKDEQMKQNYDLTLVNHQQESLDTQETGHLGLFDLYHKDQVAFTRTQKWLRYL